MADKVPRHVAIIPDGNRRWARERNLGSSKGHEEAGRYRNIKNLVDKARELGVEYLSAWGFSTENWARNEVEKRILFRIFTNLITDAEEDFHKEKVRFVHLGRKDRIPKTLREKIENLESSTGNHKGFCLILCLDYGGRDEIVRGVNRAVEKGERVTEESFFDFLGSAGIPGPDLIIRTGGERRLSGFMPYQSVYSEILFVDKYFPDFTADDLERAIEDFVKRERRFGGDSGSKE